MTAHSHSHHEIVKLTIQLTEDERTFIKLQATNKRMTISEFIMSFVRPNISQDKEPNVETKKAIKDIQENKNLERYKTIDDFWAAMGIDPNA
ncbi:MAG: hypothetical protein H0W88_07570 [Parachlamydiaceae bacterium]|nr:hypothetical protein [Parachlamydiaceae bacterium]